MSARRELRNKEREWRAAPNKVRRAPQRFNENRVLAYFGVAAIIIAVLAYFGLLR